MCRGVPGFLIVLPHICGAARKGKGTLRVPLGQRIADGSVDEKFFSRRRNGKDVHDGVFGVLKLKWVNIVIVVNRCGFGYGGKLRDGYLDLLP